MLVLQYEKKALTDSGLLYETSLPMTVSSVCLPFMAEYYGGFLPATELLYIIQ
jgi:hypothetical protein